MTTAGLRDGSGKTGAGLQPGALVALAILTLIYTFNFLDRQILSILNEPIKAELHLSDTQLGLLSGIAFAAFYTTFAIPLAWYADRAPRLRIVLAACAVWSLFCAACGLANSFAQLALARIGVGVGEAGGSAPAHSALSDFFPPERRASAMSVYTLATALGPALGAIAGGTIADRYGWRMAFFAVGLPGVLIALGGALVLREPARGATDLESAAARAQGLVGEVRRFAADPLLRTTALGAGAAAYVAYAMGIWAPAWLMRDKGMSLGEVSLYYGLVSGVANLVGTVGAGFVVDALAPKWPRAFSLAPAIAFVASAPLFALALWAPGWPAALALLALPILLTNSFVAPTFALIQNTAPPHRRSLSAALMLLCLNLIGLGLGPLSVGMISDRTEAAAGAMSLRYGLAALIPVMFIAAALYLRAARHQGAAANAAGSPAGPTRRRRPGRS